MFRFAAVLITLSLAACGMKGSLELPAGPAPSPLLGPYKTNAAPEKSKAADVSMDNKPNQK